MATTIIKNSEESLAVEAPNGDGLECDDMEYVQAQNDHYNVFNRTMKRERSIYQSTKTARFHNFFRPHTLGWVVYAKVTLKWVDSAFKLQ